MTFHYASPERLTSAVLQGNGHIQAHASADNSRGLRLTSRVGKDKLGWSILVVTKRSLGVTERSVRLRKELSCASRLPFHAVSGAKAPHSGTLARRRESPWRSPRGPGVRRFYGAPGRTCAGGSRSVTAIRQLPPERCQSTALRDAGATQARPVAKSGRSWSPPFLRRSRKAPCEVTASSLMPRRRITRRGAARARPCRCRDRSAGRLSGRR
jgi:hypothetical protein